MRYYRGFGEEIVGVPGTSAVVENAGRTMNPEVAVTTQQVQQDVGTQQVVEAVTAPPVPAKKNGPNWLLWGAVAVGAWWFWKKK